MQYDEITDRFAIWSGITRAAFSYGLMDRRFSYLISLHQRLSDPAIS